MLKKIDRNHPLIGTWITEEEDSSAEITIAFETGHFRVTGYGSMSKEKFIIENLSWDGKKLKFTSRIPSSNDAVKHMLMLLPDLKVDHELTFCDAWKRKDTNEVFAKESFDGIWINEDEDETSVEFNISKINGKYVVEASNRVDGEKFIISNTDYKNDVLSFTSLVPSNNYRVRYSFKRASDMKLKCEYTICEVWKKK
jgi:hypothetical protein